MWSFVTFVNELVCIGLRWSRRNGHGESNFPVSWKHKNRPVNGNEPSTMWPFERRPSAA
jgi:hypothetical protein